MSAWSNSMLRDDGDVGQVLQELRGLVEERAVVLVALDDEVAAVAQAIARAVVAEIARRCRRRARSGPGPPCASSHPASAVVVVLPCVPATTIDRAPHRNCSRTASGSEQYRILRSSTSSSSGLPREMALPTTTRSRSVVMCAASYPSRIGMPSCSRRCSSADRRARPTRGRPGPCVSASPPVSPWPCRRCQ